VAVTALVVAIAVVVGGGVGVAGGSEQRVGTRTDTSVESMHATTPTTAMHGSDPTHTEIEHGSMPSSCTRPRGATPTQLAADGRFLTWIECDTLTVSRFRPGAAATKEQRGAARRLGARTLARLRRVRHPSVAERLGYRRVDTHHWVNPAYLDDGRVLDPRFPEALVFQTDKGFRDPLVIGAMYLAPPRHHGPQSGGPLTVWHYHEFGSAVCALGGAVPFGQPDALGHCDEGVPTRRSAEMLHVWIDNQRGPFDSRMTVPSDVMLNRIARRLAG
jgi:hypothetical protein